MADCPAKYHNTCNAYRKYRCRCPEAKEDMSRVMREYRERKKAGDAFDKVIDATATQRMIRALFAAGWTSEELSERLGYASRGGAIGPLKRGGVYQSTHNRISALYDTLQNVPGPSVVTRTRAQKYGYAPPMAWDDITDPDAEPQGVRLEERKRFQKARELVYEYQVIRDSGMGHEYALRELGVTHETWWKAQKTAAA